MQEPKSSLSDKINLSEIVKAYAALLVAVLIISSLPILIRFSETYISPSATILNRLWIAVSILVFWDFGHIVRHRSLKASSIFESWPDRQSFLLLLVKGFVFAAFQVLWAVSLTITSVANAETLHSLTPLWVVLIGWCVFSRKFDCLLIAGITISLIGSLALTVSDFSISTNKLAGDSLALLSAFFWSLSLLLGEKLQKQMNIVAFTTWNCFLGAVFLIPTLFMSHGDLFPKSGLGWLTLIILGLAAVCTQSLSLYSLKSLSSELIATIFLLNPIISAILAWLAFSETLNLINWFALIVILLGIYVATLSKMQSHSE